MDRVALLRCRRERETPEEKEVRLSGRREYYRQLHIQNHMPTTFIPHVCMHSQACPSMLLASV